MLLDGKEFDVSNDRVEDFFTVMDKFEKVVLSKDLDKESVSDEEKETFCVYVVSNHAIGLPKEAKNLLEPFSAGHRFMCFFVCVLGFLRRGIGWKETV